MAEPQSETSTDMTAPDLFKVAVSARQLEIQMFWQRSAFFLVLSTAVAAGYFASLGMNLYCPIVLAVFGFGVSILWARANRGGRYWQVRWEAEAEKLEAIACPGSGMFSAKPDERDKLVWAHLGKDAEFHKHNISDLAVLRKPSVSRAMMSLAMWFSVLWIVLFAVAVTDPCFPAGRTVPASGVQGSPPQQQKGPHADD